MESLRKREIINGVRPPCSRSEKSLRAGRTAGLGERDPRSRAVLRVQLRSTCNLRDSSAAKGPESHTALGSRRALERLRKGPRLSVSIRVCPPCLCGRDHCSDRAERGRQRGTLWNTICAGVHPSLRRVHPGCSAAACTGPRFLGQHRASSLPWARWLLKGLCEATAFATTGTLTKQDRKPSHILRRRPTTIRGAGEERAQVSGLLTAVQPEV